MSNNPDVSEREKEKKVGRKKSFPTEGIRAVNVLALSSTAAVVLTFSS